MIWFTSDLHLGHARIIELCQRPFSSVEEMDEAIIARWNERIAPTDIVWCLGDFAFGTAHATAALARLKGRKMLITGNHDHRDVRRGPGWEEVLPYHLLIGQLNEFVLFHYPIEEWHNQRRGAIHLHGHQHNKKPVTARRRVDVGVDANDFRPWSIDEIEALVAEH